MTARISSLESPCHAAALRNIGFLSMLKRLNSVVNGQPSVARTMAPEPATAS